MPDARRFAGLPTQRRRQSQQLEAREQAKLKALLELWMPPGCFWTMLENRPRSAMAGMFQKMRGVRSGLPDLLAVWRGMVIFIELKSPIGTLSKPQRRVRAELVAAGAHWWLVRSARAAMAALHRSGVRFREIERPGGSVARWRADELADWEQPRADTSKLHPAHPKLRALRQ